MTVSTVRRLAADIMGVGQNKIRISTDDLQEVKGALTRGDVKTLIDKGIVTKAKPKGRASKKKTKRRGRGSKKGKLADRKFRWMEKVRAQRKFLKMLIESKTLDPEHRRSMYGKIKSGIFRSKKALLTYLKDNKLVAEDYEPPKVEKKKPEPKKKPAKKEPAKKVVKND